MGDFWIGDYVLIKSKGLKGRYHGDASSKRAWVKFNDEIILVDIMDIEITSEPELSHYQKDTHRKLQKKKANKLAAKEIDLHLDNLDPQGNISQFRMLDFQVETCETFLEDAIQARYRTVLIIHGKGAGLLKGEVQHVLESSDKVEYTFEKNNGGATEVWLKI